MAEIEKEREFSTLSCKCYTAIALFYTKIFFVGLAFTFSAFLAISMDLIEILKQDYQRFPSDQTYSIYAQDVYFQDPMNQFRGSDRYRKMINFISTWFADIELDLHDIRRVGDTIETRWTLSFNPPIPWKTRIVIPGWSELKLNDSGLIESHIDYWDISRLDVFKQLFQMKSH